ncbi:MAG TPA: family 20 glycosylhydrolase [Actinomycetes bacterium]|nr:family 20 glycosylhydrolase [Actinomycetes bacterium]
MRSWGSPRVSRVVAMACCLVLLASLAACGGSHGARRGPKAEAGGTAPPATTGGPTSTARPQPTRREAPMQPPVDLSVIPAPASVRGAGGPGFALSSSTRILTPPGSPAVARVGASLAEVLRRSTGYPLPVAAAGPGERGAILLEADGDARLGDEGYELEVTAEAVTLRAHGPEGLFRATQTLRQLLPPAVEGSSVHRGPWRVPAVRITDRPRFAWRGAALDVARHFFSVDEVKRYIDLISLYKLNVLHLHLTDDQGWRIAIDGWPRLTSYGGRTEVGGGPGGFYTKRDYQSIVRYAQDRYITVVPEIDVPGHVNAALSSYPELNCDGRAPRPYTGINVGFTSLCLDKPVTYEFLDDVIGELAALTPGPYLHIGGDEAKTVPEDHYTAFVERVQEIVRTHGKRAIGWQETAKGSLLPSSVVQYWDINAPADSVRSAARRGAGVVLSPASKVYLDMKYDSGTTLGLQWAGHVEVRDAYDWDPARLLDGVGENDVLGVEAQLWSETLRSVRDMEFMAFPRLPGVAEVGWSPESVRTWDGFRHRLAAQAPRWSAMDVHYHRSPQVFRGG